MDRVKLDLAFEALCNKLEEQGFDVCYLALQGSQNYNLDTYGDEYESDFDWKIFVFPSFDDVYHGVKVSKTFQYEYGQYEVKDIRLLPELLSKMNSSYLELLYTPYYFSRGLDVLREMAEDLLDERAPLLIKTLMGMCLEKQKALCHEYAGLKDKLEKFGGYDPKQLHHAYRILFMMEDLLARYFDDEEAPCTYQDILCFCDGARRDKLLEVKVHGVKDKESAVLEMESVVDSCKQIYSFFWNDKQPALPVSSDTLHKIEEVVFEKVKAYLMG